MSHEFAVFVQSEAVGDVCCHLSSEAELCLLRLHLKKGEGELLTEKGENSSRSSQEQKGTKSPASKFNVDAKQPPTFTPEVIEAAQVAQTLLFQNSCQLGLLVFS